MFVSFGGFSETPGNPGRRRGTRGNAEEPGGTPRNPGKRTCVLEAVDEPEARRLPKVFRLQICIDDMDSRDEPPRRPDGWPRCTDEQIRVMVLGTYHMANPGRDLVNVEADDVLDAERQAGLEDLADLLSGWAPDRVAVELPHEWQADVETAYESYRTGQRAYDRAEPFPDPLPDGLARTESVQIGFRLADRLDHAAPLAVDHESRVPATTTPEAMEAAIRGVPAHEETSYPLPDPAELAAEASRRLARSTLPEYHRWMNEEPQLRENHALLFGAALDGEDADAGIGMVTAWYERNLRAVRTLRERLDATDDRVLLLFGSGHVRVLRHLLDEAPMFCPVSPLPSL